MPMTSHRPYIIRALYEWILENDCTPYILVNAYEEGAEVPQEYVKDGQIVLNIAPVAVHDLRISNEAINFNGRFGGVPSGVYVPINAVLGIYARENGQGMMFDAEKLSPQPPPSPGSPKGVSGGQGKAGKGK